MLSEPKNRRRILKSGLSLFLQTAILLLAVSVCNVLHGQTRYPTLLKIQFDSVVAYDMEYCEGICSIVGNGQVTGYTRAVKLSSAVPSRMNEILSDTSAYADGDPICFYPHLGIVYFHRGSIRAFVDVCMTCNQFEINFYGRGKRKQEVVHTIHESMRNRLRKFFAHEILIPNHFSHDGADDLEWEGY
jgi:hypothetical protein